MTRQSDLSHMPAARVQAAINLLRHSFGSTKTPFEVVQQMRLLLRLPYKNQRKPLITARAVRVRSLGSRPEGT